MSEVTNTTSVVNNFKKQKEDAIKKQNGELPPDLDQDGKMINPHNPEFITKVPWYLGSSGPTLKHHNVQKERHELSMNEADQLIRSKLRAKEEYSNTMNSIMKASTGYKKGSCKNCGSTTHSAKDCVERPRSKAKSSWKTGISMSTAPDIDLNLETFGKVTYAGKRDQWSGYDPAEHQETVARYERMEEERRKRIKEEKQKQMQDELTLTSNSITNDENIENMDGVDELASGSVVHSSSGTGTGTRKKKIVFAKKTGKHGNNSNSDSDSDSDVDSDVESDSDSDIDDAKLNKKEFKAKDEEAVDFQGRQARQGGVGGAQMMTTVRNLRIREDTPKYLRNLNLDSAHYDAKSRSMRSNPLPGENPNDLVYAGDNFAKLTGDALILAQTQVMCWDMQGGKGMDSQSNEVDNSNANNDGSVGVIDLLSNPSQAELLVKKYKAQKEVMNSQNKKDLLDRYGTNDTNNNNNYYIDDNKNSKSNKNELITRSLSDARLRLGQTEVFHEYSTDGRVLKGPAAGVISTKKNIKYDEDVYTNNHTSVWGSYYHKGLRKWGYDCCHSLIYHSYCTGVLGKEANDNANGGGTGVDLNLAKKLVEFQNKREEGEGMKDQANTSTTIHPNSTKYTKTSIGGGSGINNSVELDKERLAAAMKNEEDGQLNNNTNNKRGYNSTSTNVETTVEDLEAYRMKRLKSEDPMANMDFDSEIVLEYN